jgi:hypothetical protein
MPQVYPADHTAPIRQRLGSMVITFVVGGVLAGVGARVLVLLGAIRGDQHGDLLRAAWVVDILAFAVAAIGLLTTFVRYRIYRRRRADLNAAGAEAYGELMVRIRRR